MKILFLLNDAPYGNDKNYNALRTAILMQKQDPATTIWVYLMSDSVFCALPDQKERPGLYNAANMLSDIVQNGGEVRLCTSCAETRGVKSIIPGAVFGNLKDLTHWIRESDKALNF